MMRETIRQQTLQVVLWEQIMVLRRRELDWTD